MSIKVASDLMLQTFLTVNTKKYKRGKHKRIFKSESNIKSWNHTYILEQYTIVLSNLNIMVWANNLFEINDLKQVG